MILHAHISGVPHLLNVGSEFRHHEWIAADVGEIHQLLIVDNLALRSRSGFNQRCLRSHENAFGHIPYLELQIDGELVLCFKNDSLPLDFLEALRLYRYAVGAWNHLTEDIFAKIVRHCRALLRGAFIGEAHLCASHACR